MAVKIWGKYKGTGNVEVLDTANNERTAVRLAQEYQAAYGRDWKIWVGRKKDEPETY
jgi:hypothetical protein